MIICHFNLTSYTSCFSSLPCHCVSLVHHIFKYMTINISGGLHGCFENHREGGPDSSHCSTLHIRDHKDFGGSHGCFENHEEGGSNSSPVTLHIHDHKSFGGPMDILKTTQEGGMDSSHCGHFTYLENCGILFQTPLSIKCHAYWGGDKVNGSC
jgi:hypothetical protein